MKNYSTPDTIRIRGRACSIHKRIGKFIQNYCHKTSVAGSTWVTYR